MNVSYTYCNIDYLPSTLFGFKIHVSGTFKNYKTIFNKIFPYLNSKKIAYKFVNNEEDIYKTLSVFEFAAEVGKLVTIYPSPQAVKTILENLYNLLPHDEEGVYILSDRPYKNSSLLFYRYGLFQNSGNVYKDGIPTVTSIQGEEWQDYPKTYFDLPNWISDIQEPQKIEESYLGNTYTVTSVLHQSGGGNVYLGKDKKYDTPIILKETRPYVLSFPNIEKSELRVKEYDLALKLKDLGVRQIISPIESVKEWINTYYIYHYIEGESLTNFCKNYSIASYSRSHKRKNLKLFKEFLKVVTHLLSTIVYYHENDLILNDIHPDNFIVDKEGVLNFIDLENSYFYGEKPFVGVKSRISLESWNFLDGKQADFHKIGNMILFLLGRLTVSKESYKDIEVLDKLLIAYGIKSNISEFIKYLFSNNIDREELSNWLLKLEAEAIDINESIPKISNQRENFGDFIEKVNKSCTEFLKYKRYLKSNTYVSPNIENTILGLMNSEKNLGLDGLSGVIVLLKYYKYNDLVDQGITILLNKLDKTDEGIMVPIPGGYYSPYVCNGLSGVIQMLFYIDKVKYRNLILELRKTLYVEFAQYENYSKGMLGIADTLLLTTYYRNSNLLHQCIKSLILNSYIYHKERDISFEELREVLFHYHSVYSFKKSIS